VDALTKVVKKVIYLLLLFFFSNQSSIYLFNLPLITCQSCQSVIFYLF
jgi:hypothetical protein